MFVIAATYNCQSSLQDGLDSWSGIKDAGISYSLSLVSRMASVFYDIPFITTVNLIEGCLSSFPRGLNGQEIIRSFVLRMVEEVIASGRTIETFILLIDEAMAMETFIKDKFGKDKITSYVRNAMLASNLELRDGRVLDLGLAISSLSIDSFGIDYSGRDVIPIILSSKLNKTEVVSKIWNVGSKAVVSLEVQYRLELMAATVHQLPRLVEMTKDIISDDFLQVSINATLIIDTYQKLKVLAEKKYKVSDPLADSIYRDIIFQEAVKLSGRDAKRAIITSVITNSLTYVGSEEVVPIPETSLIMLWISASKGDTEIAKALSSGIDTIVTSIAECVPQGKLWEICYYEWMKIRMKAAIGYRRSKMKPEPMSIAKLLGITNTALIPSAHRSIFTALLRPKDTAKKPVQLSYDSYTNPNGFREEIFNGTAESKDVPITIVIPSNGEAWDLCLKIFAGKGKKPMYVFIENKSMGETLNSTYKPVESWLSRREDRRANNTEVNENNNTTVSVDDLHQNGKQYKHTKEVMGSVDFVYIYFKTHNVESFTVENAIEMGRSDSMRYLGPLYELYKVGRSVSSSIDLTPKKKKNKSKN